MSSTCISCIDSAPKLKPAEFQVLEVSVEPAEVMTSDKVTVTATINNVGEIEGTYTAELRMGQSVIDSKDIPIPPGSVTTTFEIKAPASGIYQLSVGEISDMLQVYDWQKYKIAYDKCTAGLGEWGFGYTIYNYDVGLLSYFQAPSKFFRIKKLTVYGFWGLYGLPDPDKYEFTVNIRNGKGFNIWSQDFLYSEFGNIGTLHELNIPDVRTDGDFYVEILCHSEPTQILDPSDKQYPPKHALYIGLCVRTSKANANITYKGMIQQWLKEMPSQEKSSFIVRVEGEGSPGIK